MLDLVAMGMLVLVAIMPIIVVASIGGELLLNILGYRGYRGFLIVTLAGIVAVTLFVLSLSLIGYITIKVGRVI